MFAITFLAKTVWMDVYSFADAQQNTELNLHD